MRWIVGLLLVGAAILKTVQLITEPAATLMSPLGGWLLPIQVGVELGVGLFVLSGLYWRQVRWVALLLFAAFATYSLSLAIGGAASCGCFGPLKVHPWWAFFLDLAVAFGLLISVRRSQLDSDPGGRWQVPDLANRRTVTAVIVSLSVLSTAVLVRYADRRTVAAGDLLPEAGGLVVLEPNEWIGKPLPIAKFIDLDLSSGTWIVLFHRHDCPDCQEAVPRYEELAIEQQVALVEVPPYGNSQSATSGAALCGRLTEDREWFVQTPVEIQLEDGVVTSASTELPALLSSTGH